ncbi:uncharacterized protein LOC126378717 [Pectinophora gossypiella]|uniref:uncharacterized protein LOC126378717 n=1 Tax=Pectinophora gossypiella TaxID=13191 RepID=UPI00214E31B7|nr:uncharacterized protein LOC126378717 [Pectinophora gossypiella]
MSVFCYSGNKYIHFLSQHTNKGMTSVSDIWIQRALEALAKNDFLSAETRAVIADHLNPSSESKRLLEYIRKHKPWNLHTAMQSTDTSLDVEQCLVFAKMSLEQGQAELAKRFAELADKIRPSKEAKTVLNNVKHLIEVRRRMFEDKMKVKRMLDQVEVDIYALRLDEAERAIKQCQKIFSTVRAQTLLKIIQNIRSKERKPSRFRCFFGLLIDWLTCKYFSCSDYTRLNESRRSTQYSFTTENLPHRANERTNVGSSSQNSGTRNFSKYSYATGNTSNNAGNGTSPNDKGNGNSSKYSSSATGSTPQNSGTGSTSQNSGTGTSSKYSYATGSAPQNNGTGSTSQNSGTGTSSKYSYGTGSTSQNSGIGTSSKYSYATGNIPSNNNEGTYSKNKKPNSTSQDSGNTRSSQYSYTSQDIPSYNNEGAYSKNKKPNSTSQDSGNTRSSQYSYTSQDIPSNNNEGAYSKNKKPNSTSQDSGNTRSSQYSFTSQDIPSNNNEGTYRNNREPGSSSQNNGSSSYSNYSKATNDHDEKSQRKKNGPTEGTSKSENTNKSTSSGWRSFFKWEKKKEYTHEQEQEIERLLACTDDHIILQVNRNYSEYDICSAFRKLSIKFHPDKNKAPKANQAFVALISARNRLLKKKGFTTK